MGSESPNKRIKKSSSHPISPEFEGKARVIPFPEKVGLLYRSKKENTQSLITIQPAVAEERNGDIEFRVVNNDNSRESLIIMTGLKCIFQKQLPKMPKDYIARLVYDRTHLSMAIVKKPLEVVGYIVIMSDITIPLIGYQRNHLSPVQQP